MRGRKDRNPEQVQLLTPMELKVMNILWELQEAYVKDIVDRWETQPLPAYNTVSTIVRILEEKGFVGHKPEGRSHAYFPAVPRDTYQKTHVQEVLQQVFAGSMSGLVSSLLDSETLSAAELADLKRIIDSSETE